MVSEYKRALNKLLLDKKLIIVSNRGPYSYSYDKNNNLVKKRGSGGLVSAFISLLNDTDFTWISVAKTDAERDIGLKGIELGPRNASFAKFIDIDEETLSSYYNNICNEVLWFVQHNLFDSTYTPIFSENVDSSWNSYVTVNKEFAKALEKEESTDKENVVFFQDYHLYLASKYLNNPDNFSKVHFTHIPWPSHDSVSILPTEISHNILKGLLSNDLVGFHTDDYVNNFLHSCEKILGSEVDFDKNLVKFDGRTIPIKAFPISIDAISLNEECSEIISDYEKSQRKIIFRADRVDPSKNIIRGFLAYERMLDLFPDLNDKVEFVAFLHESRSDLQSYQKYLSEIIKTVDRINLKHGSNSWKPIHLRVADNYYQTLKAYLSFDVLLINSIADGMNLVAKEGPLVNKVNGVVVLSSRTGAHNEFKGVAITVNPFDVNETAISLYKGLTMPRAEKEHRSKILKDIITKNNSAKWLYHQINSINS